MKRSDIEKFKKLATEYVNEWHDEPMTDSDSPFFIKEEELRRIADAWDEVFDSATDFDDDYVEDDDYWEIGDEHITYWMGCNLRCRAIPAWNECIEILAKDVEDWFARHPEFDRIDN